MATASYVGTGTTVTIPSAAANVTGGTCHVENGFHGVVAATALQTAPFAMAITGEFEIDMINSSVQGDLVAIKDSDSTLVRVAQGSSAAAASGYRAFARVSAVYGSAGTGTHGNFPKTGKMWVILVPQGNPTA